MHFFKAPISVLNALREYLMGEFEPWPIDGTVNDGVFGFVAIGNHLPELLSAVSGHPDVEEITKSQYLAAMPPSEAGA